MDVQTSGPPIRHAAGGVVYRFDAEGALLLLLIRDKYEQWTLPKGHLEAGENETDAALREVLEETGVAGELGALVGRIDYTIRTKGRGTYPKQVAFYLMHAASAAAQPQAEEGISAAKWFAPATALTLIGYSKVRDMLARGIEMLASDSGERGLPV